MATTPGNQEKEETQTDRQGQDNNEDIAKEIPTVTPDQDNLEPIPDPDGEDK